MIDPTTTRDQAARLLNDVQALPPETPAAQVTNTLALAQALATLSLHDLIQSGLASTLNLIPVALPALQGIAREFAERIGYATLGMTRVGGVCVRGHVWALGDDAEGDCGSKSWPLYVGPAPLVGEPEDAVVVLRQAASKADDGGQFRALVAGLVRAVEEEGTGERFHRVLGEARAALGMPYADVPAGHHVREDPDRGEVIVRNDGEPRVPTGADAATNDHDGLGG